MNREAAIVYVVDDDESVRRAIRRLLLSAGLEVQTFESAEAFLEEADLQRTPACLVLDVHLGGMSGPELCDKLAEASPPFPILFITARDEEAQHLSHGQGILGLLHKPFDTARLLAIIEEVLSPADTPVGPA